MEDISKHLNLPLDQKEISLLDAICLNPTDVSSVPTSLSDLPVHMLRRIMFFDNSSRELPNLVKSNSVASKSCSLSAFWDENDDESDLVHPMDVFLYLFLKSQHIFRQTLVNHVSKCQLSLPLITHDSNSGIVSFNHFAFQTLILSRFVDDKNARSFSAVEEPLPIISFIRVSDCQFSLKSEILNRILKLKHEYFFHQKCKDNIERRFLLNGTVEIAWYLAKSKPNNVINRHFIMLNLRGNACNNPIQYNFLGSISTLLYVFVPFLKLTKEIVEIIEYFHTNFKSKVIFLIYKGKLTDKKVKPDSIPKILSDDNTTIRLPMKNIHSDSEIIASSISTELDNFHGQALSLTDCIEPATQVGMVCDTRIEQIASMKHTVDTICKDFPLLSKQVDNNSCTILATLKKQLLPLQGEFGKWADANRKLQQIQNDVRGDFEVCNTKLKEAQLRARQLQAEKLGPPSGLLKGLLNECSLNMNNKFKFDLFWNILSNHLDAISRRYLPFLYDEYKKYLLESNSTHPELSDIAERDKIQTSAKANLRKTAQSLTESSIGIEHIFRELGQTFEAFDTIEAKKKSSLKPHLIFSPTSLPCVMADLILNGQSFEVVNGDDDHVPVQWVSEVLLSLSDKIGADKKIFVISVLGIQSSGKSTLLNTMFGINFPVSSGRCTRGVYMQMIPVHGNAREELGYDYIILLDTEGLRAPELSGNVSYKKDNEMATFIVGLGDITVINIRGESHSEVQDILQITIIAFIRMRQTFSKPKCFFVHQNVGDTQAHNNLMVARTNLIDTLNEMTECAAQQENKELQFCQFGDVIEFNPEEDVFYFPSLFEGDPPMTSISSGYIEKAEAFRSKLITCCSHKNTITFQTMKEWRKKLNDLWNSVLKENFVFSYRNILELNCYVELDTALCTWFSEFTQEMTAKKSTYFNILSNVENNKLKATIQEILQNILEDSKSVALQLERTILEDYFVNHAKKFIFEQWISQTERYFSRCREDENMNVRKECDLIFRVEEQKQIIDVKFESYQKEIVKIVRDLFEKYRDQVSFESTEAVRKYFDTNWTEWVSHIKFPELDYADVSKDLQQVLLENPHLKQLDIISDKTWLIREVDRFKEFGINEFYDISQPDPDVQRDSKYYKVMNRRTKEIFFGKIKKFFSSKESKTKYDEKMHSIIQELSKKVCDIIEIFFPQNSNYSIDYFHILIDKSITFISEHNKSENDDARESLILTNHFIFDFVFYQCCKAIKSFELLQDKFLEQNSLECRIEQLKCTLFEKFCQLCAGIHSENVCANHIATVTLNGVKEHLKDTVFQILHRLFINDPEHGSIYSCRSSLQLAILKDLAIKKNFQEYISYIKNPFDTISTFIEQKIYEYSFNPRVKSNIFNNLENRIHEILKNLINVSQSSVSKGINTWHEWKEIYHTSISTLVRGIRLSDLDILDVYTVDNFQQFSELLNQALKDSFSKFDWKEWIDETLTSSPTHEFKHLQEKITGSLVGCKALCPFCREPCQLSAGEHEHYCGSFHRPQGINGWHYVSSEKICIEGCAEDVLLKNSFIYDGITYNYTDYRTVNDNFSRWKILGEDYIDSKYWQWVLCTFHGQFVDFYKIERNDAIGNNWCYLSEEDVISDLEKHYQNYAFKNFI